MNTMDIWQTIIDWLHRIGLHIDPETARAVGDAAGQVGDVAARAGQAVGQMDMASMLALAAALGWASGFRLYAVVFVVGLLGATGLMPLPGGLHVLQHPMVLVISGGLLFVEFFADKIPLVDSAWDMFQSVLRIPAGAALAAMVFGADNATMATLGREPYARRWPFPRTDFAALFDDKNLQLAPRRLCKLRQAQRTRQARRPGAHVGMARVHHAPGHQRRLQPQRQRHRLPGGHPAGAVL